MEGEKEKDYRIWKNICELFNNKCNGNILIEENKFLVWILIF